MSSVPEKYIHIGGGSRGHGGNEWMERVELAQDARHYGKGGSEFAYEDLKGMDYCMMEIPSGDTCVYLDIALYSYGEEYKQMLNEEKNRMVLRLYGGRVWLPFVQYVKEKMDSTGAGEDLIIDSYETNWFISIFRDSWVDLDLEKINAYIIYRDDSKDVINRYQDFWGNPKPKTKAKI